MTLGQRIQELRRQQNLSQEELGTRLGVSRQAVSRWEMDGAVPDVDKLIAMSKLFSVTLNDLLGVESPAAAPSETAADSPAPQIVIAPVKSSRWNTLLAVLLCLCLLLTGSTAAQLRQADQRLTRLEQQGAVITALDPNAPLVAAAEFRCINWNGQQNACTLAVTLTAAQVVPDLKVTLQAADQEGSVWAEEMQLQGGSIWHRGLDKIYIWSTPITLSAIFDDGKGGGYTQPLFTIDTISPNQYNWKSLWDQ